MDEIIRKSIKELFEGYLNIFTTKKKKNLLDIEDWRNLDIRKENDIKEKYCSFKLKSNFSYDKIFDFFPHFDFRYFTMFYSYLIKNSSKHSSEYDIKKQYEQIGQLVSFHYNNWYIYSIIILRVFRDEEQAKAEFFNTEKNEYFESNYNYFSTLNVKEHFTKYKENIEKSNKVLNNNKTANAIEVVIESVLIGFDLFIKHDTIMQEHKVNYIRLLQQYLELINNKTIFFVFDLLIKNVLISKFYSSHEKIMFFGDVIRVYGSNRQQIKLSSSLINNFLDFIEECNEGFDQSVKSIMMQLFSNCKSLNDQSDYQIRFRIVSLHQKFYGLSLFEKVKWIFQSDQRFFDLDNCDWIQFVIN